MVVLYVYVGGSVKEGDAPARIGHDVLKFVVSNLYVLVGAVANHVQSISRIGRSPWQSRNQTMLHQNIIHPLPVGRGRENNSLRPNPQVTGVQQLIGLS